MSLLNLKNVKNVYIIGIEGAGTSALACILKAQGKNVIGSDEGDHFYYDVLKKEEIKVFHKFAKKNLKNAFNGMKDELGNKRRADLIIYSTSIQPETNPELQYAMETDKQHFKIMSYPQALGMVFNQADFGIAVCGTHGKTTTTAMLATAMDKASVENITALVGSKVLEWEGNTLIKKQNKTLPKSTGNKYFIIEADEYQNKLQYYKPQAVILTSADYDHPDFFKTEEDYLQVFKDFVARIPQDGFLVAYAGDKNVVEISKSAQCEVIFYDEIGAKNILLSTDFCSDDKCRGNTFGCCPAIRQAKEKIKIFGTHNLLNATAAFKVIQKLGLDEQIAKQSLQEFSGTARRFEIKGKYKDTIVIDDYAHHPVEIQATLQSARERYSDKKIKCIFHPHTFTRTEALLDDFAKSFSEADEIYLLDIFGSAREKQGGVSSDDLIEKIKEERGKGFASRRRRIADGRGRTLRSADDGNERDKNIQQLKIVKNLHTINEATKYFQKNLTKDDILITMGAGDVYLVGAELIKSKAK